MVEGQGQPSVAVVLGCMAKHMRTATGELTLFSILDTLYVGTWVEVVT